MQRQPQIFLAHASEDKSSVRRLYTQLMARGFKPWLDKVDLLAGQNWQLEIPKAIDKSDLFIACFSKQSVAKRSYVQKEFRLALDVYAQHPPGSIYFIPVKLDDCEMPNLQIPQLGINLQDIHWIELWEEDGFERLVDAIKYAVGIQHEADTSMLGKALFSLDRVLLHGENVHAVAFSPKGDLLASAGRDKKLKLWDLKSNRPIHVQNLSGDDSKIVFSPNGEWLVSATYHVLDVRDPMDGSLVSILRQSRRL